MFLGWARSHSMNTPNLSTALVQATGEARDQGQGLKFISKPPLRVFLKLFPPLCGMLLGGG